MYELPMRLLPKLYNKLLTINYEIASASREDEKVYWKIERNKLRMLLEYYCRKVIFSEGEKKNLPRDFFLLANNP